MMAVEIFEDAVFVGEHCLFRVSIYAGVGSFAPGARAAALAGPPGVVIL